uniref:Uncharacterized protein n=1 Tax=Anguilla anguilla TaxID=7936 RepID=A0A0E9X599_ANGAN
MEGGGGILTQLVMYCSLAVFSAVLPKAELSHLSSVTKLPFPLFDHLTYTLAALG